MQSNQKLIETRHLGIVLETIAILAPHPALPVTQALLALYQLRPNRLYDESGTWCAKIGQALIEYYRPAEITSEREMPHFMTKALARQVNTEPFLLNNLLYRKQWHELSLLFFSREWQDAGVAALEALHCVSIKSDTTRRDFSTQLQVFYGFELPDPRRQDGEFGREFECVLSELSLLERS